MKTIKIIGKAILTLLLIGVISCENNDPATAPDMNNQNPVSYIDNTSQDMLEAGPLSETQLTAITLPQEKIQVAVEDLNILRSKKGSSLQKRFVSSWYIPYGSQGWTFTGDSEHGKSWLYFPRYALKRSTKITMDWESTGFLEGGAEFSPHGIQFNKPVTVWISYKDADLRGINEQDLRIWYFNEDDGVWELIGDIVDTKNKMVGGLLHHFSRYAVGYE